VRLRFDERHRGVLRLAGSSDELPAKLALGISLPLEARRLVRPRLDAEGELSSPPLGAHARVEGEVWIERGELRYALRVDGGELGRLGMDARKSGFREDLLAASSTLGGRITRPDGSLYASVILRLDPRDDLRAAWRSLRLAP
jgi:hypothetical protein